MIRRFYISLILLLLVNSGFGQNSLIDSLKMLLKSERDVTHKVKLLHKLFLTYEFIDVRKAKNYLDHAFSLSKKSGDNDRLADTYTYYGYLNEDRGDFSDAIKNYSSALKIYKHTNDLKGIADSYRNLGNVYYHLGNYSLALKNYFGSLKIAEKINNPDAIADAYNNIGNVYCDQQEYTKALNNYKASLKIKKAGVDREGQANSYCNIGIAYYEQKNLNEALKNFVLCLKIKKELKNEAGIATAFLNIENVYVDQSKSEINTELQKQKSEEAMLYCDSAITIFTKLDDKSGMAASCTNIGIILSKQKKLKEAYIFLNRSLSLSKQIGSNAYLRDTYAELTRLDSLTGNFKGAYENNKFYILYRDSLNNEETQKQTIQSQMTYEFEKKEAVDKAERKKELENQQFIASEKSRKQNIITVFIAGGLLLVLIFAGFIFRSLRTTRKQKSIIELQKLEVELQKHMVEEKQREVMDSIRYAKRIQMALLPSGKYIERNLEKLVKKN